MDKNGHRLTSGEINTVQSHKQSSASLFFLCVCLVNALETGRVSKAESIPSLITVYRTIQAHLGYHGD